MSEYIEIEAEISDEGNIFFATNLQLTADDEEEFYTSTQELEEGSPVAQALAAVNGIDTLYMSRSDIVVTCQPGADWHTVIADVTAALKDFFL